jgi:acylphosphatase
MTAMSMQRVVVRGRVQGVNFRHFVVVEAEKRRLEGWVRNRNDGTVEAVFNGPDADVAAMIASCRTGPPHARVDAVDVLPASQADLDLRKSGERFSRLN